ncbi:hypothetical protein M1293_02305 [Candidatus Parvarchaeota archaeon]|nr:hypothetical protein [Candidatus Parvarchaeota archaeon]
MKAQELPVSTIVLIVMGLVILVLALVFIVLPAATTHFPAPQATNISAFAIYCEHYCSIAVNPTPAYTLFCQATAVQDGQTYHCYSEYQGSYIYPPDGVCNYTTYNGYSQSAGPSDC